jgi:hypothetical protein
MRNIKHILIASYTFSKRLLKIKTLSSSALCLWALGPKIQPVTNFWEVIDSRDTFDLHQKAKVVLHRPHTARMEAGATRKSSGKLNKRTTSKAVLTESSIGPMNLLGE